ncbi:MAG: sulfatase-like hydrolase/transferase [Clostridia bacterium]|nr:sulfatase-like hydrolase/transferase [Clostridia bacterium]
MEKVKKIGNHVIDFLKSEKFRVIFNFIIFPLLIVFLADVYYKLISNRGLSIFSSIGYTLYSSSKALIVTWLLIAVFNAILICVLNSSRKAMIIISVFFLILLPVNDFKYNIMGNPVKVSDVNFLNADNTEMMVDVMDTLKGEWMIRTIIKSVVYIAIFGFGVWGYGKINFKFENKKKRIISGLICFGILLLLVIPPKSLRIFMLNKIFDDEQKRDYRRRTTNSSVYSEYGFVQGLYYSFLGDYILPPKNYSREKADEIVEKAISETETTDKKWGEPNVVFILSESFWDISMLDEYEFSTDLTSNIKRLEKTNRCISYKMLSPSFGGASTNVEFEMLTGGSISYFNNGYIPYLQLYKNSKTASNMPNLISEYNKAGYYTKYISSWGRTSYNSEKVFKIIGADDAIYEDDLKNVVKKGNIADSYMMDVILDELKDDSHDKKFLFVTTAQNHMPYTKERYSNYDVEIARSDMSEDLDEVAQSYAQGVYDADKELGRLYDEIQKLDEPTVVVFFGDHLPYLISSDGENMIEEADYFNTDDDDLNELRQHTTQSLIISNFDIDKDESMDFVNSSYIGSYVLNKMVFDISDYFKYIEAMRTKLPVYNRNWVYKNGKFIDISDLDEDDAKAYDDKQQVQYRFFVDNLD